MTAFGRNRQWKDRIQSCFFPKPGRRIADRCRFVDHSQDYASTGGCIDGRLLHLLRCRDKSPGCTTDIVRINLPGCTFRPLLDLIERDIQEQDTLANRQTCGHEHQILGKGNTFRKRQTGLVQEALPEGATADAPSQIAAPDHLPFRTDRPARKKPGPGVFLRVLTKTAHDDDIHHFSGQSGRKTAKGPVHQAVIRIQENDILALRPFKSRVPGGGNTLV